MQSIASKELINLDKITDVPPSSLSIEEVMESVMGVSSDMSIANKETEELSTKYLETLSLIVDDKNAKAINELTERRGSWSGRKKGIGRPL